MFCYKCGTQLAEDAAFCHSCGTQCPNNKSIPNSTETGIEQAKGVNEDFWDHVSEYIIKRNLAGSSGDFLQGYIPPEMKIVQRLNTATKILSFCGTVLAVILFISNWSNIFDDFDIILSDELITVILVGFIPWVIRKVANLSFAVWGKEKLSQKSNEIYRTDLKIKDVRKLVGLLSKELTDITVINGDTEVYICSFGKWAYQSDNIAANQKRDKISVESSRDLITLSYVITFNSSDTTYTVGAYTYNIADKNSNKTHLEIYKYFCQGVIMIQAAIEYYEKVQVKNQLEEV